jgi:DNA modification methylase
VIQQGDALDLISTFTEEEIDLIATDPPYAFGGSGDEHAISATVAVVLRESARRLRRGSWMLVFAASSWRSISYMVEAVRGIVEPVRVGTWCKPVSATKVRTPGWNWASVSVIAFRKGKSREDLRPLDEPLLDHVEASIVKDGRRAQLPPDVAAWAVKPFVVPGGVMLDPFAGSGVLVQAADFYGMRAFGFEKNVA